MTGNKREWTQARNELVKTIENLGFPESFGEEIAKNLGSPKAMKRMNAYLCYEKPDKAEIIVDEMLAICSEIEAWRSKKAGEEANARYTEMLNSRYYSRVNR